MKPFLIAVLLSFISFSGLRAQTPAPPPPAAGGATQLFQIVLLVGSTTGEEAIEGLPKSAEKAIADIRDFLPFKRYRMLDSGLIRASTGRSGEIIMAGVGGQQYRVSLMFRADKLQPGDPLTVLHFDVAAVSNAKPRVLAPGEAPAAPTRGIVSTAFSLTVGETIVVGSSKLGGSDALVVLLTAIPPTR